MGRTDITEIYRRYGPLIYSRYRRSLGNEREAIEATVKAFEGLRTDPPPSDEQVLRYLSTLSR